MGQSHIPNRRFPHPTNGSLSVLPTVALTCAHNMKPTGSLELGCNIEKIDNYPTPEKGKSISCQYISLSIFCQIIK